jgi:hypothetical protein
MHVKEICYIYLNSDFLFKINLIYKTTEICSIFNADLSFSRNNFFIFLFKLSKHNIYLTVKFTNKIHSPFSNFLFTNLFLINFSLFLYYFISYKSRPFNHLSRREITPGQTFNCRINADNDQIVY